MIAIMSAGPLCSIQDGGREGYRDLGLSRSGAMDHVAHQAGNALCGNPVDAPSLEMTVFPVKMRFDVGMRVAITGASCSVSLDGKSIPPWWSFSVEAGQVLTLGAPTEGARSYLAVPGGFKVPRVLDSFSTDIKSGFGGFEGRCVKRGDVLEAACADTLPVWLAARNFGVLPPQKMMRTVPTTNLDALVSLRVLPAAEYDHFSGAGHKTFWQTNWQITPDSNRIGFRLEGPEIEFVEPVEMLSHGILPGVIQVPPSGRPIIIMSDGQTCGGYPKIGTVIEADLWRLAQAPIGAELRFEEVSIEESVSASKEVSDYIKKIEKSLWRAR